MSKLEIDDRNTDIHFCPSGKKAEQHCQPSSDSKSTQDQFDENHYKRNVTHAERESEFSKKNFF